MIELFIFNLFLSNANSSVLFGTPNEDNLNLHFPPPPNIVVYKYERLFENIFQIPIFIMFLISYFNGSVK